MRTFPKEWDICITGRHALTPDQKDQVNRLIADGVLSRAEYVDGAATEDMAVFEKSIWAEGGVEGNTQRLETLLSTFPDNAMVSFARYS